MAVPLILIIEDDAHIGGLVSEVLREAGYASLLSPNVNRAREEATRGIRPAAIISDLVVEGAEDPATLASEIEAIFPGVPVTLMTGVPPKRRAHLGVTHDRVLEKPFELESLLQAVRSMLDEVPDEASDAASDTASSGDTSPTRATPTRRNR